MNKPTRSKIFWLVREDNRRMVIGLLRDRHNGCLIIGGPAGSHYTGHGESWESKGKEYLQEGYIDVDLAKKNDILASSWHPPKIGKKDQIIISSIKSKKI